MRALKVLFVTAVFAASAFSHSFWINLSEHTAHKPGHLLVNIGWGHKIPIDDTLNSQNGSISLENFTLIDEKQKRYKLYFPFSKTLSPFISEDKFEIYEADFAFNKISLKDTEPKNLTFESATKPSFFTQYIDKEGKTRIAQKPLDEIKDISKILMSLKYQGFAKRYFNYSGEIKPLGHALEIMPKGDISNLKVGDEIAFEVLFNGEKLVLSNKLSEFIRAENENLGQVGGTAYYSFLMDGTARIKLDKPGQWVVSASHGEDVEGNEKLKELRSKAKNVFHSASLAFEVKER